MSTFNASYPAGASGSANPSVGTNGAAAPTSSTEIGFINGSGNLQPVTSSNPLPVDITLTLPNPLPVSDATTHTELTTINTTLGSPFQAGGSIGNTSFGISGSLPAGSNLLGQVGIDQTTPGSTNGVVVNASALPSGAATSALQTTGNASLATIATNTTNAGTPVVSGTVAVSNFPATQPVSGTVAATQSGTWTVQTKAAVNTTGSGSAAGAAVSTVITLTAPANAVGFILMSLDTSTANIRWGIGRTASTTLGQQLQPGRDTGFVPCGANVSICAESGTQNYDIQWVSQ